MPEQFRLHERGGQAGEVHRHKRPACTRRASVDEAGKHLLAGAGLAADEHGHIAASRPAGQLVARHDRHAAADDLVLRGDLFAQRLDARVGQLALRRDLPLLFGAQQREVGIVREGVEELQVRLAEGPRVEAVT